MTEPPLRKRFQIHLSTAIVMMFVAGGLMWANVNGRRVEYRGNVWSDSLGRNVTVTESEFFASQRYDYWYGYRITERGWPFDAIEVRIEVEVDLDDKSRLSYGDKGWEPRSGRSENYRSGPIIYNALVALGILFSVCFTCEYLIRRRD